MPRKMIPINKARAIWAEDAARKFAKTTRLSWRDEPQTVIKDLLCDLMHLCDENGFDYHAIELGAKKLYDEEVEEESDMKIMVNV